MRILGAMKFQSEAGLHAVLLLLPVFNQFEFNACL